MHVIRTLFASVGRLAAALDRLSAATNAAADLIEDRTGAAGAIEAPPAPPALALDCGNGDGPAEPVKAGRGRK